MDAGTRNTCFVHICRLIFDVFQYAGKHFRI